MNDKTTYRKKLIEVALPLEAINKAAAREKSIRHGHPSTLHLWWARRPLAACRAVLFASLVDDPDSDPVYRKADGTVDEEWASVKRTELFNLIEELVQWENSNNPKVINRARAEIARCVASRKIELGELKKETVIYEKPGARRQKTGGQSADESHSDSHIPTPDSSTAAPKTARGFGPSDKTIAWDMVTMNARPEAVNAFLAEHAPPVLDPFCGGGSIPLEAQRLGLRAYGSDLNPVAVLINKALIEIPPRFADQPPVHPEAEKRTGWSGAQGLAEDVRRYGQWMRDEAEKRIGHLYPKVKITKEMARDRPDLEAYVGKELTVIAWLWARTVRSADPSLRGNHVPLAASFWLSKKKGKEVYVEPIHNRADGIYEFKVRVGKPVSDLDPSQGTVVRTGGRCLLTGTPLPFDHIRDEGKAGRMRHRLMAIVCEGQRGRVYLNPIPEQEEIAQKVIADDYPVTDLPKQALGFRVQLYGMDQHWKLFTQRQLTALVTFSGLVGEARAKVLADASAAGHLPDDPRPLAEAGTGPQAYADAVATYLAFVLSKSANYWSSLCAWATPTQKMISTFGRQALPMVWDYAEANPFSGSTGNYESGVKLTSEMVEATLSGCCGNTSQLDAMADTPAVVQQIDATVPRAYAGEIISTDPPYYDNIGYADLSDFFYVWLRRTLKGVYPRLLSTMLAPKNEEMIASPYRHGGSKAKAAAFFEEGLGSAIGQWRNRGCPDYPTTIFYAFKQAETTTAGTASTGWETFLAGVIGNGFAITGTWPMRTELTGNLKKHVSALASSIVLACVPRPEDAPMATRREFAEALRAELPEAIRNMQAGSVAPVDLAQASIGPGMAVFSRYNKVINADGSPMSVREALQLINQVLDESLTEQESDFDAETRFAIKWFEQYSLKDGPFGDAETLAKALAVSVKGVEESGIARSGAGKVRLLKREEMDGEWDPRTDARLTIWEVTQHLIRRLQNEGEESAAALLRKLGGTAEIARDLAYRLYTLCERKKWADEALAYNGLVIVWPELTKLSMAAPAARQGLQGDLFA